MFTHHHGWLLIPIGSLPDVHTTHCRSQAVPSRSRARAERMCQAFTRLPNDTGVKLRALEGARSATAGARQLNAELGSASSQRSIVPAMHGIIKLPATSLTAFNASLLLPATRSLVLHVRIPVGSRTLEIRIGQVCSFKS